MLRVLVFIGCSALALSCVRYEWVNELHVPGLCDLSNRPSGRFQVVAADSAEGTSGIQGTLFAVTLTDATYPLPQSQVVVQGRVEPRAVTDANGTFVLALPPGEYALVSRAIGFRSRLDTVRVTSGRMVRVAIGLYVEMNDGPRSGPGFLNRGDS